MAVTGKPAVAGEDGGAGNGSGGGDGGGGSESLKRLLGGAGVLQAALTAIGVSNGGVAAMVINHRAFVTIGFGAVLASIAIGALVTAIDSKKHEKFNRVCGVGGTLLLFFGIGVTGYTALAAPAIAKAPSINTELTKSSEQLVLSAKIKATGIPESSEYWVEIDAREYVEGKGKTAGRYAPLGTPLYQSQLGADSEGNVEDSIVLPLVSGKYNVVSVEAWSGPHAGPCGSLQVQGGANLARTGKSEAALEDIGRAGCAVLRLPR